MATQREPAGLGTGGRQLWRDITADHDLSASQRVQLVEACRAKDRLDKLDALLRGDADSWCDLVMDIESDGRVFELRVTNALSKANETANLMKQLIAALRLPDEHGKIPQRRGPRGAQAPSIPGGRETGKVSSLDRARAAKTS